MIRLPNKFPTNRQVCVRDAILLYHAKHWKLLLLFMMHNNPALEKKSDDNKYEQDTNFFLQVAEMRIIIIVLNAPIFINNICIYGYKHLTHASRSAGAICNCMEHTNNHGIFWFSRDRYMQVMPIGFFSNVSIFF